jgi:hypothetical protein
MKPSVHARGDAAGATRAMSRLATRGSRLIVVAILAAIGLSLIIWAIADWHLHDMEVYEAAAWRIRNGEPLYGGDVDALSAYRYAPWFAYAWVPLTYLPPLAVRILWSVMLLVATTLAAWPLARGRTRLLLLLFGPILVGITAIGNVHPAMMALLMLGLPTRWGGIAVGIAASLKVVPIILVLQFVAERRWRQVGFAVVTALVLWLPVLGYEIAPVSFDAGVAQTLATPAWVAAAIVAISVAGWLAQRRSRFTALASATAGLLALPRLFVYDVSLLMVGALPPRAEEAGKDLRTVGSRD